MSAIVAEWTGAWRELALRERLRVAAVALVTVAAFSMGFVRAVPAFRTLESRAVENERQTATERLLVPAYGVDISRDVLLAAMRLIPRNASYSVDTGTGTEVSTPLTLSAVYPFAQFLLMPRRQIMYFPPGTNYVICYGCDLHAVQYRSGVKIIWQDPVHDPGIVIARRA